MVAAIGIYLYSVNTESKKIYAENSILIKNIYDAFVSIKDLPPDDNFNGKILNDAILNVKDAKHVKSLGDETTDRCSEDFFNAELSTSLEVIFFGSYPCATTQN